MNEFKGTPGPWIACDWLDGEFSVAQDSPSFSRICKVEYVIKRGREYNEEMEANARLIAAAPELLKAIVAARSLWGDYLPAGNSNAMKAMKLVDAAITKALGENNENQNP